MCAHEATRGIVRLRIPSNFIIFASVARTTEGECLWRTWWYSWPATRKPLTCSSRSESKIACYMYMYICTSLEPRLSSSFLSLTERKAEWEPGRFDHVRPWHCDVEPWNVTVLNHVRLDREDKRDENESLWGSGRGQTATVIIRLTARGGLFMKATVEAIPTSKCEPAMV